MRNNYSTRRRNMHRNKVTVHTKKASSSSSFVHFVTQKGTRTVKKKRKRQKKETKERKKERKNFDTEGDDDDDDDDDDVHTITLNSTLLHARKEYVTHAGCRTGCKNWMRHWRIDGRTVRKTWRRRKTNGRRWRC